MKSIHTALLILALGLISLGVSSISSVSDPMRVMFFAVSAAILVGGLVTLILALRQQKSKRSHN